MQDFILEKYKLCKMQIMYDLYRGISMIFCCKKMCCDSDT